MQAIEFEANIQNGLIVLPREYQNYSSKRSRIIVLLSDEKDTSTELNRKEKLRLAFTKLQEANPFKTIDNPVEWQKQLRNEWE